jgi:uncharacterized membrane protein (UPF0127 family)
MANILLPQSNKSIQLMNKKKIIQMKKMIMMKNKMKREKGIMMKNKMKREKGIMMILSHRHQNK